MTGPNDEQMENFQRIVDRLFNLAMASAGPECIATIDALAEETDTEKIERVLLAYGKLCFTMGGRCAIDPERAQQEWRDRSCEHLQKIFDTFRGQGEQN